MMSKKPSTSNYKSPTRSHSYNRRTEADRIADIIATYNKNQDQDQPSSQRYESSVVGLDPTPLLM